ncbi:aminoglycoside N(3)-acetyltransferase [Streptomyces sp. NBC_01465]|uniref:aminoglycoside N(3)-acetyltransferase n=1 Tax=Streptomyces sp. NBC_01465 TaxID=2903878 RepID=UPI002E33D7D1|nr:AAC(3) family N-acetyltransferase [Streptomyces sp. NBC_01465]
MHRPPHSQQQLTAQFAELGVETGGLLVVHASLRALGAVDGGAETVVRALQGALGESGTVVVPTFTAENSDTSPDYRARVQGLDEEAAAAVRERMPAFDRLTTPASPTLGVLAETVRRTPGAERSAHPQTSFAALGSGAGKIVAGHLPDCHLGEDSPLARLYDGWAQVLLLGTGFDACSAFHLGEYRVPNPPRRTYRCVITTQGRRTWWSYEDVDLTDHDFAALGDDFERGCDSGTVKYGQVGDASCRLFHVTEAADFAKGWLPANRPY